MYKDDLALNNLQWLICHKTQPNQNLNVYFKKLNVQWSYKLDKCWKAVETEVVSTTVLKIF